MVLRIVGLLLVVAIAARGAFYWPYDVAIPALAAGLAIAAARRSHLQRGDALVVSGLLAFGLWATVDALTRGNLGRSTQVVGSAIGFVACFVIGRSLADASRAALRDGAVVVGAVAAAIGLVGVALRISPLALPAHQHLRLAGTLTYSNAMGALLAMLLVAALTTPVSRWRDAALVLISGGVLATQSRGVLLALLLSLVLLHRRLGSAVVPLGLGLLLGLVTVAGSGDRQRHPELIVLVIALPVLAAGLRMRPRQQVAAAGVLILAVIGLAAVSGGLRDAVHSRLNTASVDDRTAAWHAGWLTFRRAPIAGTGPGTELRLDDGRSIRFVHNEPLQIAVDTGLIGVLLVGLAFAVPLVVRRTGPRVDAAPAVLVVFVGCAMTDFPWHLPAIAMTAGLMLTGLPTGSSTSPSRLSASAS